MESTVGKRQELLSMLGELPSFEAPIRVLERTTEERDGYVLERLLLDLNGMEPVPALLALPRAAADGARVPAVVFNHSHGGFYDSGKRELIEGAPYLQPEPYAESLTKLGVAALSIDAWGFGSRHTRKESEIFKEFLWRGRTMWGMMVYDSLRAVSYLAGRDEIDASRIGTMGMSMGGTMSWWLSALDERIRFCADLCGVADYDALIEERGLDLHGIYYYVPGLLTCFSSGDINALVAPRPRLCQVGRLDRLTPGIERLDAQLAAAYRESGAEPGAWDLRVYEAEHVETAEMRRAVLAFVREQIR